MLVRWGCWWGGDVGEVGMLVRWECWLNNEEVADILSRRFCSVIMCILTTKIRSLQTCNIDLNTSHPSCPHPIETCPIAPAISPPHPLSSIEPKLFDHKICILASKSDRSIGIDLRMRAAENKSLLPWNNLFQ